jgi:hypothetical protein
MGEDDFGTGVKGKGYTGEVKTEEKGEEQV